MLSDPLLFLSILLGGRFQFLPSFFLFGRVCLVICRHHCLDEHALDWWLIGSNLNSAAHFMKVVLESLLHL